MSLPNPMEAFIWGAGGAKLTPEQIAQQRKVAAALMGKPDFSPAKGGWLEVLGRGLEGVVGGLTERQANKAELANATTSQSNIAAMLTGGANGFPAAPAATGAFPPAPAAPSMSQGVPSAHMIEHGRDSSLANLDMGGQIKTTAEALGIDPVDLATAISYETAGTFDPMKKGPTTQWGQHRGLIQFGEPQAKQYGVDWSNPVGSQLGPDGAVAKYLRGAGVEPGMGMLDIYSAINAGRVGRYDASDANNGGAPGTVRDKVEKQMAGHRQKAMALLGPIGQGAAPAALEQLAAAEPTQVASLDPTVGIPEPVRASRFTLGDPAAQGVYDTAKEQGIDPVGNPIVQALAKLKTDNPDMPVAPSEPAPSTKIAQALTVADPIVAPMEDLSQIPVMAGGTAGALPPEQVAQGINPAIIEALSSPYASENQRKIAGMLLGQQMEAQQQASDPMRQIELEKGQLELEALRNPQPKTTMQNLQWRASQAGLQPGTPEYQRFMVTGGSDDSTNITVNTGEGDKFYENLDKKNAEMFSALSDTGLQGRSKLAQIDRLEGLLGSAPQGAIGALKLAAGEYGINTEGLSDIQAAEALINEIVPMQRPPGSGTMSDADLALFRRSLPRLINQPGGNQTIIDTMRGVSQYQVQMGEIADAVADRTMTAAEGRKAIRDLPNPLENFGKPKAGSETQIAKPTSEAEYNAMPSGAEFIAPDGSKRRKP